MEHFLCLFYGIFVLCSLLYLFAASLRNDPIPIAVGISLYSGINININRNIPYLVIARGKAPINAENNNAR